jgi:hypothetical protein
LGHESTSFAGRKFGNAQRQTASVISIIAVVLQREM